MTNETILADYKKALNNCSAKDFQSDLARMKDACERWSRLNQCSPSEAARTLYNLSR